jgi:hypothetical protein
MVRDASGTIRIGFTFGTGLVARFFDRYYAAGGRGMPTAAAICARVFAGSFVNSHYAASVLEPMRCHLVLEEREQPDTAYSLIVSSVLRNVGLHMFVTYRAERDPRRLHLVASSLDTRELGPQAWRVLLGRPLMGAGITDELVESFAVSFSDATGPYVLDGDLFTASRVDVGRGPELDVLVP